MKDLTKYKKEHSKRCLKTKAVWFLLHAFVKICRRKDKKNPHSLYLYYKDAFLSIDAIIDPPPPSLSPALSLSNWFKIKPIAIKILKLEVKMNRFVSVSKCVSDLNRSSDKIQQPFRNVYVYLCLRLNKCLSMSKCKQFV